MLCYLYCLFVECEMFENIKIDQLRSTLRLCSCQIGMQVKNKYFNELCLCVNYGCSFVCIIVELVCVNG